MTPSLEFDAPELNLCVPQSNLVIRNGLPAGGTSGQHIVKKSDTDYDTEWETPAVLNGKKTGSAKTQYADGVWNYSFAEGYHTEALGEASHAQGWYTSAYSKHQSVSGRFNVIDANTDTFIGDGTTTTFQLSEYIGYTRRLVVKINGNVTEDYVPFHSSGSRPKSMIIFTNNPPASGAVIEAIYAQETYAEIVGNGEDNNNRSNARTLDWEGNETLAGSLTLGSTTITEAQLQALLALL